MNEYDLENNINMSSRLKEIWYKYNKYIILSVCIILILIIVLILRKPNDNKYSDIERIMIINAQNYVKNNNIEGDIYVSLNNLNIKLDDKLKCNTLSGVHKENDNYLAYLICDNYYSKAIKDVIEENRKVKEYTELIGNNPQVINESAYYEEGVKASQYKVNIKGNDIDNGLNVVTYSITNNGKYIGELKRIVIAENIVGNYPTLTLIGDKTKTISQGSKYVEQGYKAIDEKDGNITDKVKVNGSVDTSNIGIYKLTYSVTNSRGKTTNEIRTIVVNEPENIDLSISHKLNPITDTNKSVTIILTVKGNGYQKTVLPDNSEKTSNEVIYTVYKNGTYDFLVYDKNNNSEVYSVKVSNIDDGVKAICSGEYENGYGLAKLSVKVTSGNARNYSFLSGNAQLQSGSSNSYKADDNMILLINPKVVITNDYGRNTTINCTVKHDNYPTYNARGYNFLTYSSKDKENSIDNPYPNNRMVYYLHIPANVSPNEKLPLIVGLHGGYGTTTCCNNQNVCMKYSEVYHYFKNVYYKTDKGNKVYGINGGQDNDLKAVILTITNNRCQWKDDMYAAYDITHAIIKKYNIDLDRVILTGVSQGGVGTLYLGFLEEQVLYRATDDNTTLSSLASKYGTTVNEIIRYNEAVGTHINYSNEKQMTLKNGSTTIIRSKNSNEIRSIYALLMPFSPGKTLYRKAFINEDGIGNPPHTLKTPIWVIASKDETKNVYTFAQDISRYYHYSGAGDARFTVLNNLSSPHDSDTAFFNRTGAAKWLTTISYGQFNVGTNSEIDKIESQMGSNFAGVWHP